MDFLNLVLKRDDSHPLMPLIDTVRYYYHEPHRHYHNWHHIRDGAWRSNGLIEAEHDEFQLTFPQQLAWVFHDIVYVPRDTRNEENSVTMMMLLTKPFMGYITDDDISEASAIIRSTINHRPFVDSAKAIIDLDLAGFCNEALFNMGTENLIKEFMVDRDEFLKGQSTFMKNNILSKDFIYETDMGRLRWEEQARAVLNKHCN